MSARIFTSARKPGRPTELSRMTLRRKEARFHQGTRNRTNKKCVTQGKRTGVWLASNSVLVGFWRFETGRRLPPEQPSRRHRPWQLQGGVQQDGRVGQPQLLPAAEPAANNWATLRHVSACLPPPPFSPHHGIERPPPQPSGSQQFWLDFKNLNLLVFFARDGRSKDDPIPH